MFCPFCTHEETKVVDSRLVANGSQIKRRRECMNCGERFSTYEEAELVMPRIIKSNERREPFDEEKLRAGLHKALEKRPVSSDQIENALQNIKDYIRKIGEREIQAQIIGKQVMNQLVTTDWLDKNIEKVKILDASWHLPNANRNSFEEYKTEHIINSIFFDIDKNSNQKTNLPHMLPSKEDWEMIVSSLGISNSDHIIVYDNSDVFSSCRVWYSFLYFGHDPKLISVLDGGFKKWTNEKRPTTKEIVSFDRSKYIAVENTSLVINKDEVNKNITNNKFQLLDARGEQRFLGLQPEPRKELKSGNIKGSINLPFQKLLRDDRTFKKKEDLIEIFKSKKVSIEKEMAFTCGSGVTACILGLANSIISGKKPVIYDGSWAEYGLD